LAITVFEHHDPMKTITLKLPEGLDTRLAAAAATTGTSKSDVARRAIEAFLERRGMPQAGSCLELARDLAGCLEGPGDLSYNKRRLKGYGQ
jgi:predicted transcriptional regulator